MAAPVLLRDRGQLPRELCRIQPGLDPAQVIDPGARHARPGTLTEETGSDLAAQLWDSCDAAVASRLAYPEVSAALAAAGRNHDLTGKELDAARQMWDEFWAATRPVELTRSRGAARRPAGLFARAPRHRRRPPRQCSGYR